MREVAREERGAVRQQPWVTYGLIALLLTSFAYARVERREIEAELASGLAEAADYFRAHPYLAAPSLLEQHIGGVQVERQRARHLAEQRSRGSLPVPYGIQRREQERLDGLVAEVVGRFEERPTQRWGLRAGEHRPKALLAHVLLHAGWLPLLAGLFLLLLLGFFLEGSLGATLFVLLGVGSTVAAASAFDAVVAEGTGAWIGSSGLLAGLLGAFAVRFGHDWTDPSRSFVFLMGALFFGVPLAIGVQWSIVPEGPPLEPSVSVFAFAAAFVFGAAAALLIRVTQLDQVFGRRVPTRTLEPKTSGQLERALEHRAAGRLDQSFTLLTNLLRQEPGDRDAALVLWDVANDLGRPAAAAPALLAVIREEVKRGAKEQAVQHWLELAEAGLDRSAEPALATRMAMLLVAADQRHAAVQALRVALAHAEGAGAAAVASRVARAASSLDPATAADAAWRALGSQALTLEERQSLEGLLAEVLPRAAESRERTRSPHPRTPEAREPAAPAPAARTHPREAAPVVDPEAELLEVVAPDFDFEDEPAASLPPAPQRGVPLDVAPTKPDAIEIETANRELEAIIAVPTGFDADGLCIEAAGGARKRVRYDRIAAISVAAIGGLGPKPVILVDLILNWMSLSDEPLRIIRLRGDRFDPRQLAAKQASAVDALRAMIEQLLRRSGASPLPDLESAKGLPFASFDDLASYHRDVLMVDGENAEAYA
jgi:membrane associated rhomboid family serine protease